CRQLITTNMVSIYEFATPKVAAHWVKEMSRVGDWRQVDRFTLSWTARAQKLTSEDRRAELEQAMKKIAAEESERGKPTCKRAAPASRWPSRCRGLRRIGDVQASAGSACRHPLRRPQEGRQGRRRAPALRSSASLFSTAAGGLGLPGSRPSFRMKYR